MHKWCTMQVPIHPYGVGSQGETWIKGPKGPVEQKGEHGTGSCGMKKEKEAGTMGIGERVRKPD